MQVKWIKTYTASLNAYFLQVPFPFEFFSELPWTKSAIIQSSL